MSEQPHIDIDYVADLARIELTDKEKSTLSAQLDDILSHFAKLSAVDVDGIEPMAHTQDIHNVWRTSDTPGETFAAETLKKMSPEQRDNQVVVPKVVE
ncbi:MAG: Asp-tRNA(Asn)/Glu-tRNA(Gln) amidotransferase subunit GatC [Verrucomicrobiota bacterium]|nr:Asp-tRNA(Asn)/Glu-tRNA(Gln) amidotransferase subunit GatC [Verrucomicrobiota bacterium]MEC8330079.1 Asp-tRNA(Asn)/Glu-tRNA(Gln) amidotransferase subunit GatC [Verrucomicrobiota bacterium]MEC8650642.1 Asp-tRNA(Asn)/Glu-tRNA(Gln) amidotransferase subunit GatC [Verrucomicrobiota bacterium]MEC9227479.1 Asp-tRNA(Asn)/Glu-tRNA(Gln) amidotransferase subunit GatC [Verrucomicrobiota bacterium]